MYVKMGNTIVFGGSGLLGNVILEKYPELISVGRTDPFKGKRHYFIESTADLSVLDEVEFDSVIFLIGNSNHHLINSGELNGLEYNVLPLFNALNYFKKRKLKKFVCLTSILLYGNEPLNRPVNESDPIFPFQKDNNYLFSKYLAEQVVEQFKSQVPIINIRLSNVYGATSLIRPDLVPTLILDSLTKENVQVWNKAPCRDFIFAEDAAEAIMRLIESEFTGTVNLGSGTSHTVGEVCDIISELSGKEIIDLNIPVSGVMKFVTDISLLKYHTREIIRPYGLGSDGNLSEEYYEWKPKHTLREGLTKSFDVMKNNLKIKMTHGDSQS